MPKTIHVVPTDRATIAACVDSLGGFPVVLKVPGGEGGQGVMRADSLPSLFSLLDYLPSNVQFMAYFEHVVAYRAVVLGPSVIATEARHPGAFDFRSNATAAISVRYARRRRSRSWHWPPRVHSSSNSVAQIFSKTRAAGWCWRSSIFLVTLPTSNRHPVSISRGRWSII